MHSDWLMSVVTGLLSSVMMLCLKIGGCWTLPMYTELCVAPNFSEQSKFWLLWFSLAPIKKSMMQIIMPKTSRLKLPTDSNPFVPYHAIPQYWTNSISFSYETIVLYLANALPNSCMGLCKGMSGRMHGLQPVHGSRLKFNVHLCE